MRFLLRKLCANKFLPVFWTILTIVLLCLPGSAIPGNGMEIFNIPDFDKIVHVILFGGIVFFWGGHYASKGLTGRRSVKLLILFTIVSIVLGIVLEYVQFYFIPQRSFDRGDILADSGGALAALLWLLYLYPRKQASS